MADKIAKRGISIFIDGKEVSNSVKGIRSEMQKLINEQNKMTIGSDEYVAHTKKIAQLKGYLSEHNQQQKQVAKEYDKMSDSAGGFFSRAANGFNKYFAMATTFIAGITGASLAFRKLAEDVAHMDDVYSDVMKTTGMTKDEVLALNEELKKMDTRTTRESLNNLARDAGKLGIEGQKNILDFVDAGNQINVALGEDLGEDAIKNIGKMVGVFETSTQQLQGIGLKEQMLAVGSAINELGASSTASEPYLVEFAGRLGGISKQAKISMADILGFASSLDQDMQAVEMSATALQNFIMKLMGDPAKFAKLAGLEVSAFTKLLSTDTNAAIKQVLQAMNEKGGFQQLIPVFQEMGLDGARAVGVLSAMAGSIDKVEAAQQVANKAMADGVSITNEYDIKNNNLAARLDKAKKAFTETALELGEKLNPILLQSVKGTTYLIKGLVELPKWLDKNKISIITLITVWTAYVIAVNSAAIADKLKVFWTDKLVVSLKKLWLAIKANPWALIATGAVLAINALNNYMNKQKAANNELEKFIELSEKAKNINMDNKSIQERYKILGSLSKNQVMELKSDIETQISLMENFEAEVLGKAQSLLDNDKKYQEAKDKFAKATTLGQKSEAINQMNIREKELMAGISSQYVNNEKSLKLMKTYFANVNSVIKKNRWDSPEVAFDPTKKFKDAEADLDKAYKVQQLGLDEFFRNALISESVYNVASARLNVDHLEKKLELQKRYKEETIDTELAISAAKLKEQNSLMKAEEDHTKAIEEFKRLQAVEITEDDPVIDTENYTMALRLKILKAFHDKGLLSEEDYQRKLAEMNQKHWEETYGESYKFAGEINKMASAASQIMANIIEAETLAVDNKYAAQIKAAKKAGKDTTALEEQVEKEKKDIKKKYADVDFAITAAKIISETAMAVMEAAPNIPLQIFVGGLGLTQLAIANEQRKAVKNLWTGGFTEPGGKYDPRGIVHAGEFVASQESVNNPQIRPVLDALDMAQRQGTASTLTADKLTRSMRTSNSYSDGGYVAGRSTAGNTSTSTNDELIRRQIAAIDRLSDLLEDGIQAEVIMSGDRGLSKQLERYNNLVKNVSRG